MIIYNWIKTDREEIKDVHSKNKVLQQILINQYNNQTPKKINESKQVDWRQQNNTPKGARPQFTQKINQLKDNETNQNDEEICEEIPDDLISNATDESNSASAFLSA